MSPENFDLSQLVNDLLGTCKTPDEFLPEGMTWEDLTADDHAKIDSEIFECASCGWWCENDELNEVGSEQYCNDCVHTGDEPDEPDEDEEEEHDEF